MPAAMLEGDALRWIMLQYLHANPKHDEDDFGWFAVSRPNQ